MMILEFTPLEFETNYKFTTYGALIKLEFTPLEFETIARALNLDRLYPIRIYSVGVWNT